MRKYEYKEDMEFGEIIVSSGPAGDLDSVVCIDLKNEYSYLSLKQVPEFIAAVKLMADIADGWVSVNDELPKSSGSYWTFNGGDDKPSVIQQRVHMYDCNHKEFNSCSVTHWMKLPENPIQG